MKKKSFILIVMLVILTVLVIAGCGTTAQTASNSAQPAATPAAAPAAPAATPVVDYKAPTIYDQWKTTGHAIYFPERVKAGLDADKKAGYGDTCIRCHSAVKRLDDPNAVLADFMPGGKYAGKDEGISCRVCHTSDQTNKGAWQLRLKGWDVCATCHTTGGRPKLGGHISHDQIEFIQGLAIDGSNMKDQPSVLYSGMGNNFTCVDCHMPGASHTFLVPGDKTVHDPNFPIQRTSSSLDYNAFQAVFNQDKCKTCHTGDKDAKHMADLVKKQQDEIGKRLEDDKKIVDEWTKKIAAMTPDQQKSDPKVKAFQTGDSYFAFVDADGSKGAHNYDFAKVNLDAAEKAWAALK